MKNVQPSIMNVPLSFPWSATQLPLELLDFILKYLCAEDGYGCSNDRSFFYAALCPCSLVSRHWAAHIRPTLFERVVLTSKEKACTFLALLRSLVVVPVLLREVVREIKLEMDEDSRPWMYHVWEILRDGVLPKLESVDLKIKGNEESPKGSQPKKGRSRCETLLDIGFPRKPPRSAHPIRLRMLSLSNLSFRSYETLLRCLTYHCTEKIMYDGIQWPEGPGSVVLPPAGHLLSQLCSHAPKKAFIWQPNSTLPILWSLITTQFPSSPAARLLYISDEQISTVMAIVHLFSDGCECSGCSGKEKTRCSVEVYTDPTDGSNATRCLSLGCGLQHRLVMQIQPTGAVSRVCLMIHSKSESMPLSSLSDSDPAAALVAFSTMLNKLDQLCDSLGDMLREVAVAFFRPKDDIETLPDLVKTMCTLRSQMPAMVQRQCLAFRMLQGSWDDFPQHGRERNRHRTKVVQHLFEHDGKYWTDITLDAQQLPERAEPGHPEPLSQSEGGLEAPLPLQIADVEKGAQAVF